MFTSFDTMKSLRMPTGPALPTRGGAIGCSAPGSISEKVFVDINGLRQGMFIRGRVASNPVLLWLHGGIPDTFLANRYPTGLEDQCTVVWWEQRGSGLSFRPEIRPESLTLEQFVADTLAVTNYLRHRFGQDRIYLMGHSGGTFVGIQAAARAPDPFHAYIGIAQMSDQLRSEMLSYDYMLERFRKNGDSDMVRQTHTAAPVTLDGGVPPAYLALRDAAMHRLGIGTTHEMRSIVSGLILPSLTFPGYTFREKVKLWRAKRRSGVSVLWRDILSTNLAGKVPEVAVPVYFFHGIYDYTCSYPPAKTYLARLRAPVKGFYTFEHSAHSPMFEEPAKATRIFREDVLAEHTTLADS